MHFAHIRGLAFDQNDNLYISDKRRSQVHVIDTSGILRPFAGTGVKDQTGDGGLATLATLSDPHRLSIDQDNNVYITSVEARTVRRVDAQTGIITTIAGTGVDDHTGDGGFAIDAASSYPYATVPDDQGRLYIADAGGSRVRVLIPPPKTLEDYLALLPGFEGVQVEADGSGYVAGDTACRTASIDNHSRDTTCK